MFCPQCGTENAAAARYCTQCGRAIGETTNSSALVFAGFWLRVGACLIDQCILTAFYFILFFILALGTVGMAVGSGGRAEAAAPLLANLVLIWVVTLVAPWLYYALFECSLRQATPGKLACRIKVADLKGARISFGRATGRYFGHWITGFTLGIGYLMVAFTQKRQALHDVIAGTVVVRAEAEPARVAEAPPAPRMSGLAIAAIVLVCSFVPLGILAAIAIPAYQDYTIRAQVAEGLTLASDFKGAVQAYYEEKGDWPEDVTEITHRLDLLKQVNRSQFVQSIKVSNGTIEITYGRNANPVIDDYMLSLRPHVAPGGGIAWQCGKADLPAGVDPESAHESADEFAGEFTGELDESPVSDPGVTSLADKYMPAACRTGYFSS